MSWEPIGRQSLGNLCKGPSVALHPSSQVTEFTSLIIGSNRKVIGIECCHRINVSQSHINVSALLYCLCLRNTVASKCCLSTVWKPSALAWPPHGLSRGSQSCLLQLRLRAAHTQFVSASLQLATEIGRQCCGKHSVEVSLHGVPPWCPCGLSCEQILAASPGFPQEGQLVWPWPVLLGGHYFRSQGVAPVKLPQATEKPGRHSNPEAEELNLFMSLCHFRN